jgi:Fe-S-cluster containining protein
MDHPIRKRLLSLVKTPDQTAASREALGAHFRRMDAEYDRVAMHYGFRCDGCVDNCCRTRFYHHTLLEYLYLHAGYAVLKPEIQTEARQRAADVMRHMRYADESGGAFRSMCPVNTGGRCVVYAHRPMICRMHGLPNRMLSPRSGVVAGPGCDDFHARIPGAISLRFDRTSHYQAIAALEQALRREVGWEGRIKMTVAEMILSFDIAAVAGGRK